MLTVPRNWMRSKRCRRLDACGAMPGIRNPDGGYSSTLFPNQSLAQRAQGKTKSLWHPLVTYSSGKGTWHCEPWKQNGSRGMETIGTWVCIAHGKQMHSDAARHPHSVNLEARRPGTWCGLLPMLDNSECQWSASTSRTTLNSSPATSEPPCCLSVESRNPISLTFFHIYMCSPL